MRERLRQGLLYVGMVLTIITTLTISMTYLFLIHGLNPAVKFAALGCLLLSLALGEHSRREMVAMAVILVICLAVALVSDDNGFLIHVVLLLACLREEPRDTAGFMLVWNTIQIAVVPLLVFAGVLQDDTFVHVGTLETAHALGYAYYSTPAYIVFFLCIIYYYYRGEETRLQFYVPVVIALNYFLYWLTSTRLTFVMSILWCAWIVATRMLRLMQYERITMTLATVMFPLMMIVSVVLPFFSDTALMTRIDQALNWRFRFSRLGFERYAVTLFGNFIVTNDGKLDPGQYFYIDCGYVNLLLKYGILVTILVLVAYTLIARHAARTQNAALFLWCVVACVFSLINDSLLNLIQNPLLIIGAAVVYQAYVPTRNNHA